MSNATPLMSFDSPEPGTNLESSLPYTKQKLEFIRNQAKQNFQKVRSSWIECGKWALPHRIKWMMSMVPGERNNQHIVDATHILALRSYVAGFLEGNTSATRPWYRVGTPNLEINQAPENAKWLDMFTRRTLQVLASSNFYHAAGSFYYDFGVFNTGAHYIEEMPHGLHFHTLVPGSYYAVNNGYNEACILVREFTLSVKALVDTYGLKDKHGQHKWSNFSKYVRHMYETGNYTQQVDVVHIIKENDKFDPSQPQVKLNKKWIAFTYEVGGNHGQYYQDGQGFGASSPDPLNAEIYLNITASKRKPFIVGKSDSSNFEYGEKGPTLDALGLIRSLNKKAIGKDQALEQMLRPALQGPANLRKSYLTTAPNSFVPLDATSLSQKGLRPIFEVNPGIGPLIQDVTDLRNQVEKIYYADYLLFLSRNPKTRTATETNAIVQEQQIVIGPNLQSLNWTYNVPVVEFVMDYVMFEDPIMQQFPPPQALTGRFLRPEFVSVFAQAQKAADLPSVDRFMQMAEQIGQQQPKIWDKVNVDMIADLYNDRLFLPAGLVNPQGKVDAMRQQAQAQAQQQEMLQNTLPAMAGAAKDMGMNANQGQQPGAGPGRPGQQ